MALQPSSVFITGCNRGIGLEFVKQFLKLSTPPKFIFATCRDPANAKELNQLAAQNASVQVIKMEVVDQESIAEAKTVVESKVEGEGLNLLINNAGIIVRTGVEDTTKESMMKLFEVNAVGPLMVVQNTLNNRNQVDKADFCKYVCIHHPREAFLPLLRQAVKTRGEEPMSINKSAIINLSTGVASITENDTGSRYPYRTSKAGLNMITKNLSLDLKADGILCTAIHPGYVKTEMGGANALITTEESVTAMFQVLGKLVGEEQSGKFYHGYRGHEIAW